MVRRVPSTLLRCTIAALAFTGSATLAGCGDEAPEMPAHLAIAGADPVRGRQLVYEFGCGTCHAVEGVPGARGTVGPKLDDYAQRSVLSGIVPNTPRTLVAWLLDPAAIDPRTGMPAVGLDEAQARDVAAFLYTLGAEQAPVYPSEPELDLRQPQGPDPRELRRAVNRPG